LLNSFVFFAFWYIIANVVVY